MIIVLLANGFEEIEALTPVDMLRRAGLTVKTVGVTGKAPTGAHGITVVCDAVPEEIDLSTVDMAIFPGGMPGADNLDKSEFTDSVIDALIENGGRLAAICAAPLVLGKRGLLRGKEATCYPGFEKHLHGAKVVDEGVVTDGNITTAKGMGVALEFARELITLTKGKDTAEEICKSIFMEAPSVEATSEDDKDVITYRSAAEYFAARDAALGILPDNSEDDEDAEYGLEYLTDPVFRDAVQVAMNVRKVSTSLLQRQLCIGYGKSAKFIDMMESLGIVDKAQGQRPRNVIMSEENWKAILSRVDK